MKKGKGEGGGGRAPRRWPQPAASPASHRARRATRTAPTPRGRRLPACPAPSPQPDRMPPRPQAPRRPALAPSPGTRCGARPGPRDRDAHGARSRRSPAPSTRAPGSHPGPASRRPAETPAARAPRPRADPAPRPEPRHRRRRPARPQARRGPNSETSQTAGPGRMKWRKCLRRRSGRPGVRTPWVFFFFVHALFGFQLNQEKKSACK